MVRSNFSRRALTTAIAMSLVAMPTLVIAQSNPFVPPSRGGGLTREQVAEIVKREIEKSGSSRAKGAASGPNGASPSGPGVPGNPSVAGMPSQPGSAPGGMPGGPKGSPVGPGSAVPPQLTANGQVGPTSVGMTDDVVATLLSDGGSFVGCAGSTPIFNDKGGRRAYFTSKELRNSHVARRFARC